nr:tetratricopeptide repeat protein [Candidatus Poribacteria bacterium]
MKFEKFGIIVYILAFIRGCGVSNYDRGVSFLGQEEFDTAIPYFEAAIDSGVNIADAHRELGITYYKKEMAQQAANHLRIATKNGRKDSRAAFFLAVALEENGDFDEALDAYRKFIKLNSSQSIGQDVRSRIVLVKDKKDNQFVQEAVTGELGANSGKTLDNRIVAHYLEVTPGSVDPIALQKSLTSLLISDLAKVDQIDVVRRSLLQKLINMIDLDQDAILNTKNIKRIGHLLRAKHVISGKIEESSDGAFR